MNNLTGKQLVEQGIVTGNIAPENIQQHGVDLNLVAVERVDGGITIGHVPFEGKTRLAERNTVPTNNTADGTCWILTPGVYDIRFAQGCAIPADKMALIRQRSSLLRNGAIIHSSVFDAGFKTEQMGTILHVRETISIEVGARVAQMYSHNSNEVENLYEGQWQGRS